MRYQCFYNSNVSKEARYSYFKGNSSILKWQQLLKVYLLTRLSNTTKCILGTARLYGPWICKLCSTWFCDLSPRTWYVFLCSNLNDLSKVSRGKLRRFWATRKSFQWPQIHAATSSSFQNAKCTHMHTHIHRILHLLTISCHHPDISLTLTFDTFPIHT